MISIELRADYTIMMLSYALSLEELRPLAERIEPVGEDGWLAAGGQILDCLPPDPGCPMTGEPGVD